jgi:putative nucleotidyltransferase with HDIG domain
LTIYNYIERENGEYVTQLVKHTQTTFENELIHYAFINPQKNIQLFFDQHHQELIKNNIIRLEIIDSFNKKVFQYDENSLPPYVISVFKTISLLPSETSKYIMLPINDEIFALVYTKKIKYYDNKVYSLKMVITLPSKTITMMRSAMKKIFIAVSIILALVVMSIFPIVYYQFRELDEGKRKLLRSNFQTLAVLGSAIALRDNDTADHNYRVTYFAIRLAEVLRMPVNDFPALIKGAFLHDIGKIGIPDSILLKHGKLSTDEYLSMKKHVDYGLDIVKSIEWLQDDTVSIIAYHHERIDGSGYPKGIKGEKIPYCARIFAIADVFDALISKRPYKNPLSVQESLLFIQNNANILFDSAMVEAFTSIAESVYTECYYLKTDALEKLLIDTVKPYFSDLDLISRLSR